MRLEGKSSALAPLAADTEIDGYVIPVFAHEAVEHLLVFLTEKSAGRIHEPASELKIFRGSREYLILKRGKLIYTVLALIAEVGGKNGLAGMMLSL